MPLYLALAAPLVAAAGYACLGWVRPTRWLGAVAAAAVLMAGIRASLTLGTESAFAGWLRADSLAAYTLITVGAVATLALAGWPQQLANELNDHVLGPVTARWYGVFAMVVLTAAVTAATSSSVVLSLAAIAVMVAAVTALVASRRKPAQRRAAIGYGAWCGEGVAVTAIATLMPQTPVAVTIALLGFAVLAGLGPVQWWLPATVSVASPPVAVLIAGVQVPVVMSAILRLDQPPRPVLLVLAAASIMVAVFGVLWQKDLRRLIAHAGVAGGGLSMIALAAGLPPVTARLTLWLGLSAAVLYLAAGHVVSLTGSGRLEMECGLLSRNRLLGGVLGLGLFAATVLVPAVAYGRMVFATDEPLDTLGVVRGTGLVAVALFAGIHARRMLTGDPAERPDVTSGRARRLGSAGPVLVIAVAAAMLAPIVPSVVGGDPF